MKFIGIALSIILVIVLLPIEIFLSIIRSIHISIKMIVALSEGYSIEEIQRNNISEQLDNMRKQLESED